MNRNTLVLILAVVLFLWLLFGGRSEGTEFPQPEINVEEIGSKAMRFTSSTLMCGTDAVPISISVYVEAAENSGSWDFYKATYKGKNRLFLLVYNHSSGNKETAWGRPNNSNVFMWFKEGSYIYVDLEIRKSLKVCEYLTS